ncbi:iron-containing alcohol dehydrogenase [Rheinheimera tilapiae]|uniref:Iron-containing alcohol dehydrogenase n=1 Tax=Rheinheimera tilapiae TaxID=875043 RepID=A0ABV6B9X4_9GAMM
MLNFTFQNPTRIVFGEGQIKALRQLIPSGARVLMTYGGGSIKHNGVYDQVKSALTDVVLFEFGGIEPNPSYETLSKAVEMVHAQQIDFLLAVGGGSVVDGTKYIAAAARYDGEGWDILSKQAKLKDAVAMGCVLTLPATGSESNGFAVITKQATQQKLSFGSPLVYPQFAVLDPTVTYSLPAKQLANGVVDAYIHVMEQYLTYPVGAAVQDRFAEGLLLTLLEFGPKAVQAPQDYNIRSNLMWSATMALNGLIGVGVPQDWSTHMIGHQLTALYGLDHAQTLAIVLPAVMQQQREQKRDKLLQYGRRVFGLEHNDEERLIDEAISHTRAFFEQMGVPTRLADYGITAEAKAAVVAKLAELKADRLGEHGDITPDVVQQILQRAL